MWNRVLLLAAGVASGWTLVHLLSVAPSRAATHRLRLALGLFVGLGLVIVLATRSLQAGLAGFLVFGFSALVAYAANAKQVSRGLEPVLPRRPSLPPETDPRTQVLLVARGEPAAYDGPQYWAHVYRERQERGERAPHWFVRPLAYARVRVAYAAMGGRHPLDVALSQSVEALQADLGPGYAVRYAYLRSQPYLVRALVALAEEGFRRAVLVPLGVAAGSDPGLRQAVADSRVRELGIRVLYTSSPTDPPGQADLYSDHLSMLDHGHPLSATPQVDAAQIQGLARLVQDAVQNVAPH